MPSKRWGWKIYQEWALITFNFTLAAKPIRQMSQLGHGDVLWEPAPIHSYKRIKLGDVGYVRRGRFHLLFSAGCPLGERRLGVDVPLTFRPLNIGAPIYSQPRLPDYLCTSTVRAVGADLGASICAVPMLEPGVGISFDLKGDQGAALVTRHRTYREDVELEFTFEAYTKRHYNSWIKFAREAGHGNNIRPVIVTGFDMTKDFAMMAYTNNDVSFRSEFTVSVPAVGSASVSAWGTWRTEGLVYTNCGPQLCCPPSPTQAADLTPSDGTHAEAVPDGYDQCVFVRYFTIRKRAGIFPTIMRAAAGPHDLGSGSRDDEELIRLETWANSDSGSDIRSDLDITPLDEDWDDDSGLVTCGDAHIVTREATSARSSPRLSPHHIRPPGDREDSHGEEDDFDLLDGRDEEGSDLYKITEYIFQNSNAESVLVHHQDIALLREPGNTTDVSILLSEKRPPIEVDANGVGKLAQPGKTTDVPVLLSEKRPPIEVDTDRLRKLAQRRNPTTPESFSHSFGDGSRLQLNNFLQTRGLRDRLTWDMPLKEGPDHAPSWIAVARLDGMEYGPGRGKTLADAEEEAARVVLRHLLWEEVSSLIKRRISQVAL